VEEISDFEKILYPSKESAIIVGKGSDWFTISASKSCQSQTPPLYTYHLRDVETNEELTEKAKIDPITGEIEMVATGQDFEQNVYVEVQIKDP